MPQSGSTGADQAAGAAELQIRSSRDKWRADAPDWIIRGRRRRRDHTFQDWIIRGKVASRPGWGCPGRIMQEEPPLSGLGLPGESGGKGRRRPEAKAKLVQQWSHDWMQRKGLHHGDAVIHWCGRGRGEAEEQSCG